MFRASCRRVIARRQDMIRCETCSLKWNHLNVSVQTTPCCNQLYACCICLSLSMTFSKEDMFHNKKDNLKTYFQTFIIYLFVIYCFFCILFAVEEILDVKCEGADGFQWSRITGIVSLQGQTAFFLSPQTGQIFGTYRFA